MSSSPSSKHVALYNVLYSVSIAICALFASTGVVDGINNIRNRDPNAESTTLLGFDFFASILFGFGLVKNGTLRERLLDLTLADLDAVAIVLNLFAFLVTETSNHALLYVGCVLVILIASVLTWMMGKAIASDASSPPSEEEAEEKKGTLPPLFVSGLVFNALMYVSSIWNGIRNIRDGTPNGQLLTLTSLLCAARLLRFPMVVSDAGTIRESIDMLTLLPLVCLTIALNLIPYHSTLAYASAIAVAVLGAVLTFVVGKKFASFFVGSENAKKTVKQKA